MFKAYSNEDLSKERRMIFITERTHVFKKSLILGEEGEAKIFDYLKTQEKTELVKDVRDDKEYQSKDIDFIVTQKNGRIFSVEVKTDQYDSQNLFYETISAVETNSIGCMEKSQAKYLIYYFTKFDKFYLIDLKEFNTWIRKLIAKQSPALQLKQFKNDRYDGSQYTSQGYTISLRYIENNFPVKYCKAIKLDGTLNNDADANKPNN